MFKARAKPPGNGADAVVICSLRSRQSAASGFHSRRRAFGNSKGRSRPGEEPRKQHGQVRETHANEARQPTRRQSGNCREQRTPYCSRPNGHGLHPCEVKAASASESTPAQARSAMTPAAPLFEEVLARNHGPGQSNGKERDSDPNGIPDGRQVP